MQPGKGVYVQLDKALVRPLYVVESKNHLRLRNGGLYVSSTNTAQSACVQTASSCASALMAAFDMKFSIAVSGVSGVPEPRKIIKVLHGTSVAAIDAIVREGFKAGREDARVRHGNANGKIAYLTTTVGIAAGCSLMYNCKYMLRCELCVDPRCIKANYGVFAQPDKALVRPLYIVEFKEPPCPPPVRAPMVITIITAAPKYILLNSYSCPISTCFRNNDG